MPNLRLTDLTVRNLAATPGKQATYHDETLPGFNLRISPGGAKTFTVIHGGDRKRITIGRYPALSLAEARDQAKKILANLTLGRTARAIRLAAALNLFIEKRVKRKNKPSTGAETERLLRKYIEPPLGSRTLDGITSRDVIRIVDAIDAPSEANHCFVAARTFFNFCMEAQYINETPMRRLKLPYKLKSRDRVLADLELAQIVKAAHAVGYPFGAIIQLLLLTGQRREEVAAMAWSELDLAEGLWSISAQRTKSDRAHVVPLSPLAISIIERLPRFEGDKVFAGRGSDRPVSGFSKWKRKTDDVSDVVGWRPERLSSACSSEKAEHRRHVGVSEAVAQSLLEHASGCRGSGQAHS